MTKSRIETPYYTIQYLLREFSNALGTKGIDKNVARKVDDACNYDNVISPTVYNDLKNKLLYEPLKGFINESIASRVVSVFDNVIEHYREFMQAVPLDGVGSVDAKAFLEQHFFTFEIAFFCDEILDSTSINSKVVAQSGQSFVSIAVNGMKEMPIWADFYHSLSSQNKERLRTWSLSDKAELPSFQYLNLISQKIRPEGLLLSFKVYFLVARLWDYFFKKFPRMNASLLYEKSPQEIGTSFHNSLTSLLKKAGNKHQCSILLGLDLHRKLRLREPKSHVSEESCRVLFGRLKHESELDINNESTYFYHWMKARLELHCGHLDLAVEEYEQAFDQVIYRQGENAKSIIQEALIASCRMEKPNKTFINRLRRMAGMLNLDVMPNGPVNDTSKKKALDIEDWEVAAFARQFDFYFTKESFFSNATYPENLHKSVGVCHISDNDFSVDLKKPNKKLKVGKFGSQEKKIPQLTYFTMTHNTEVVDELLRKGADVNKLSSNCESALLFAVQEMQVNVFPIKTMKDDIFWMLAEHEHTVKTLDSVTTKRKLTPLGCGVQTGRLEVVQKLIEMGSTVDRRHEVSNETPLFTVIAMIGRYTRPEEFENVNKQMQFSDLRLQFIRAHGAGFVPHDFEQLKQFVQNISQDEDVQQYSSMINQYQQNNLIKYASADELRIIARYLIEQGANPNAKHNGELEGYTPLMFAVELDEVDLVHTMLQSTKYKGNLSDTCFFREKNLRVGLFEIACRWGSKRVLKLLDPLLNS